MLLSSLSVFLAPFLILQPNEYAHVFYMLMFTFSSVLLSIIYSVFDYFYVVRLVKIFNFKNLFL